MRRIRGKCGAAPYSLGAVLRTVHCAIHAVSGAVQAADQVIARNGCQGAKAFGGVDLGGEPQQRIKSLLEMDAKVQEHC